MKGSPQKTNSASWYDRDQSAQPDITDAQVMGFPKGKKRKEKNHIKSENPHI